VIVNTHYLTCGACQVPGPLADNRGVARFRALNAGWSTARGRELCPGCTAAHNARLTPTPDVALATLWEPAHVELPGRRKITPSSNSKEQTST
jgi:hypothetical protein